MWDIQENVDGIKDIWKKTSWDMGQIFQDRKVIIFERSNYWDTGYYNVQFQKISILPPTEGNEISWGVGGSVRPKNLKKCTCMKPYWISRGVGRS